MATQVQLPEVLVGTSTKMYFTHEKSIAYAEALSKLLSQPSKELGLFYIPSFPSLIPSASILSGASHIILGAQDCHEEDTGAFTGCVSPKVLKEIGCNIVELGHAERRRPPFNENDALVSRKAAAVVRNKMIPLVCIGEKAQSMIASEGVGLAVQEILPQIQSILVAIPETADVVFAYEPIWAIGASEPASADHVKAVVGEMKRAISASGRRGRSRVIYGGSAGVGTWSGLSGVLDGMFLGRFAHDPSELGKVLEEVRATLKS